MSEGDIDGVSPREAEVLAEIGEHQTNTQIAAKLHLSVRTVETHVSSLLRKFGVKDRRTLAARTAGARRQPGVGCQLPTPPPRFVGRGTELARMNAMMDTESSPAVTVLSGPGGIGKTWLALHWAYANIARFPDGQVYVNLRGFDQVEEPMDPHAALRSLLETVGVAVREIPDGLQARAGLFRSRTRERRMLFVLDNARDSAQITPLLPGGGDSTIVVTSRMELTALTAAHAARHVDLPPLDDADARRALAAHTGADRLREAPEAVADIIRYCAGIPLALGTIAARIGIRPDFTLADVAGELADDEARLDALDTGDLTVSLRAAFAGSRRALSPETARLFVLFGAAPGTDIGVDAVAGLAGLPRAGARRILGELERANLVERPSPGRYRMHDLIQLYARECADSGTVDVGAARRRLVDFYLHTAHAGARALIGRHNTTVDLEPAAPGSRPLTLDKTGAAQWFDAEYAALRAVQHLAADSGLHAATWKLAWAIGAFQWLRGFSVDGRATWTLGLAAAREAGDRLAQAMMHRCVGDSHTRTGDCEAAARHLDQALSLADATGDVTQRYLTHTALAELHHTSDRHDEALRHTDAALALAIASGDDTWRAWSLNAKGWFHAHRGELDQADRHCREALDLCVRLDDAGGTADTHDSLGYITHRLGDHARAVVHYQHAVELNRGMGNAYKEANALEALGTVCLSLGDGPGARDAWRRALRLYEGQHRSTASARVAGLLADRATG